MLLTPQPASSRQRAATDAGMQATRHTLDLVLIIGLRFPFIAARGPLLQPIEGECMPRQIRRTFEPSHLCHHTCVQALASAMARHYSDAGRKYPLAGERVNLQALKSSSWSGR